MNILNEIKIGGLIMKIRQDSNLAGADGCFGVCDHMRGEIVLDSNQPQDHKEVTLLHEIIEKINKEHEMGLEHKQITALATCLYQVTIDNPQLINVKQATEDIKDMLLNLERSKIIWGY